MAEHSRQTPVHSQPQVTEMSAFIVPKGWTQLYSPLGKPVLVAEEDQADLLDRGFTTQAHDPTPYFEALHPLLGTLSSALTEFYNGVTATGKIDRSADSQLLVVHTALAGFTQEFNDFMQSVSLRYPRAEAEGVSMNHADGRGIVQVDPSQVDHHLGTGFTHAAAGT